MDSYDKSKVPRAVTASWSAITSRPPRASSTRTCGESGSSRRFGAQSVPNGHRDTDRRIARDRPGANAIVQTSTRIKMNASQDGVEDARGGGPAAACRRGATLVRHGTSPRTVRRRLPRRSPGWSKFPFAIVVRYDGDTAIDCFCASFPPTPEISRRHAWFTGSVGTNVRSA